MKFNEMSAKLSFRILFLLAIIFNFEGKSSTRDPMIHPFKTYTASYTDMLKTHNCSGLVSVCVVGKSDLLR